MATENNPVEITTIEDAMAEINKLQAELAKEKKATEFHRDLWYQEKLRVEKLTGALELVTAVLKTYM